MPHSISTFRRDKNNGTTRTADWVCPACGEKVPAWEYHSIEMCEKNRKMVAARDLLTDALDWLELPGSGVEECVLAARIRSFLRSNLTWRKPVASRHPVHCWVRKRLLWR